MFRSHVPPSAVVAHVSSALQDGVALKMLGSRVFTTQSAAAPAWANAHASELLGFELDQLPTFAAAQSETTTQSGVSLSEVIDPLDWLDGAFDGVYTRLQADEPTGGTHAYVLFSGISPHPEYAGRLSSQSTCVSAPRYCGEAPGYYADQDLGNGVAGVIAGRSVGVYANTTLHAVKAGFGEMFASDVLSGMQWILEAVTAARLPHPSVALVLFEFASSQLLNSMVEELVDANVVVVTTAGFNTNTNACLSSPFSAESALSVSAAELTSTSAVPYPNAPDGPCVDVYGPVFANVSVLNGGYNTLRSQFVAPAFVAGAAAALASRYPCLTARQVAHAITNGTTRVSAEQPNTVSAMLNLAAADAVASSLTCVESPPPPPLPPPEHLPVAGGSLFPLFSAAMAPTYVLAGSWVLAVVGMVGYTCLHGGLFDSPIKKS
jgi:hypothetical protein